MSCGRALSEDQYWTFCGETEYGSRPALCVNCNGSLKLKNPREPHPDYLRGYEDGWDDASEEYKSKYD